MAGRGKGAEIFNFNTFNEEVRAKNGWVPVESWSVPSGELPIFQRAKQDFLKSLNNPETTVAELLQGLHIFIERVKTLRSLDFKRCLSAMNQRSEELARLDLALTMGQLKSKVLITMQHPDANFQLTGLAADPPAMAKGEKSGGLAETSFGAKIQTTVFRAALMNSRKEPTPNDQTAPTRGV